MAGRGTYKIWKRYTGFKMAFYQCVALLYMGIHFEEMRKTGERLAYFQVNTFPIHNVTAGTT